MAADFETTIRFWLDRGVDGFRIDVAHGMAKAAGLPDMDRRERQNTVPDPEGGQDPRFDVEEVHDVHRLIRRVLDAYPGTGCRSARSGCTATSDWPGTSGRTS